MAVNRKNFNAIVFSNDDRVGVKGYITYHKQTNLERLLRYFDSKYPQWVYVTIYDRKTNEKELLKRSNFFIEVK